MKLLKIFALVISVLIISNCQEEKLTEDDLGFEIVIDGLFIPWELSWGPDGFLWFTERNGLLSRMDPDTGDREIVLDLTDQISYIDNSEAGLLGFVHSKTFSEDGFIYLVYNHSGGKQRLSRFTYNGSQLVDEFIFPIDIDGSRSHCGSRLLIDEDNRIIMSTGDGGDNLIAQDLNSLSGKILRINLDGSIPDDNLFGYIYSYGHRNAQGLAFHPNGKLYSSEHGPDSDDEINIIQRGKNYGWPHILGEIDSLHEESVQLTTEESIYFWTPTIAPSDLIYYDSDRLKIWKDKLLLTTLKDKRLISLKLNDAGTKITKEESYFEDEFGRLRDIAMSPTGRLFIATNGEWYDTLPANHKIIEIVAQ